jgi:hypothetical protein
VVRRATAYQYRTGASAKSLAGLTMFDHVSLLVCIRQYVVVLESSSLGGKGRPKLASGAGKELVIGCGEDHRRRAKKQQQGARRPISSLFLFSAYTPFRLSAICIPPSCACLWMDGGDCLVAPAPNTA